MKRLTRQKIDDFLNQKTIAIVGVSRTGKKFGNLAYRELKEKGYQVFPVHREVEWVGGDRCYSDLHQIPEKPGGVLVVVPPQQAQEVVKQAARAGIRRIWLQQGAESDEAIAAGRKAGLDVISGECILMFAEPAKFWHRAHRELWKFLGKLP